MGYSIELRGAYTISFIVKSPDKRVLCQGDFLDSDKESSLNAIESQIEKDFNIEVERKIRFS